MNKLNDSSFIDFLGNSRSWTTTHICLLKTWQECEIKSNPRNSKDEKKRQCGKSCLKGPPKELRISLSKSGVFHKMHIRQICTENLGVTLLWIKSSSFKPVFSSATRGCRGTIKNYFPLPSRWATRAQSCFSQCSRYHSTHTDSKQIEPYPSHAQTQHQRGLTCWNTGFHSHIWRAPTCHPTNHVVNHFTSDKLMVVPSHLNATKTQTLSNYLFIYLLDFHSNFCLRKNTQTLDHTLTSCYYTDFQIPIIFLPPTFLSSPHALILAREDNCKVHHLVAPQNSVQNRRSHTVGKHVEKREIFNTS